MADQIDRLIFQVSGQDRGGGKVLSDTAKHADAAHQSMSKLGSTLSGLGGPFDQITSLAGDLGDALDGTVGKTAKLGLGLTAAGAALIAFGAKDAQAQKQLQQTVDNTGQSYADYRGQVEEAISAQEKNAHTADDTQNALNTLTIANQDVTKSLSEMAFVADIAAQKHEDLAHAAQQLVQMEEGNSKAFRSFGLTLDTTKDRVSEVDKNLRILQGRLSGQAGAAVDTTAGKFKVWGVELEDTVAKLSKYGPLLVAAGVGLTAVSAATQILIARRIADTAAAVRETAANTALAASYDAVAASAGAAAVAQGGAGAGSVIGAGMGARVPGILPIAARVAVPAAIAYGTYQMYQNMHTHDAAGLTSEELDYVKSIEGKGVGGVRSALSSGGITSRFSFGKTDDARIRATLQDFVNMKTKDKAATDADAKSQDNYATSLLQEKAAATQAANSIDGHLKALQDSVKVAMDLQTAQDDASTAMHNLAQSVHDGSTALKGYSTNAINNRGALRDVVTQELDVIQALREHHVRADKVTAAAKDMSKAIEHNAEKLGLDRDAVRQLLRQLGVLPGQIEKALSATALLAEKTGRELVDFYASGIYAESPVLAQAGKYAAAQAVKGLRLSDTALGGDPTQSYTTPDPKAAKAAEKFGQKTAHHIIDGAAPVLDNGINDAVQKALDKAKQRMQAFAALEQQTAQQITSAYQNTKQGLIDAASLANRPEGTDLLGASGPAASILASKRQFAHQMIHFARLIHRLEEARYNPTVIDEVEGLGTVAGIEAANELLAGGRKERRAINRAEARIERAAGRISSQITGQDYNAEILKTLQRLPDQFDRKFEHTLRKLHIITDTGAQDRKQGHRVRTH